MTASSKRHALAGTEPLERIARFAEAVGAPSIREDIEALTRYYEHHEFVVALVGPAAERRVLAQLLRDRVPSGLRLVERDPVQGTSERSDLALVAAPDTATARGELARLGELGLVRRELAVALIGANQSPGALADAASQIVVLETPPNTHSAPTAWMRLIELFARRMAGTQASSLHCKRSIGMHRALVTLRHLLLLRSQALARPHVAQFEAARIARYSDSLGDVLGMETEQLEQELAQRVAGRLETERTKFLMSITADLLSQLECCIASLQSRRAVRRTADALAHDLLEAAIYGWREALRVTIAKDLATLDKRHRDRMRGLLCGVEHVERDLDALAGTSIDMFRASWQVAWDDLQPSPLDRIHDLLLPRAAVNRRAAARVRRKLLARLETNALKVVTDGIVELGMSRLSVENHLRDAVHLHAELAHAAVEWAAPHHAAGPRAVERARANTTQRLAELSELAATVE